MSLGHFQATSQPAACGHDRLEALEALRLVDRKIGDGHDETEHGADHAEIDERVAGPAHRLVDLWVQAPGDVPVGYSNESGVIFNLVRDDLGKGSDPNSMNYEIAYGRGHWPEKHAAR
jgi:hypothetical protein